MLWSHPHIGKTYYFNRDTKSVSWEVPPELKLLEGTPVGF